MTSPEDVTRMTGSEFLEAKEAQTAIIRRDLALLRGDPTRRRRHRILEVVCAANHPVIEVLVTSTWGAICFTAAQPDPRLPKFANVQERIEHLQEGHQREQIRAGDSVFFAVALPITDDERQLGSFVDALCRCSQHRLSGKFIATALRRGDRRVKMPRSTL